LHPRSLRTRFGLTAAILVLIAVILLCSFVYVVVARGLRNSLDEALRVSGSLAASTVGTTDGTLILGDSFPDTNTQLDALRAQGTTVRYLNAKGEILGGFGLGWNSPPELNGLKGAEAGQAVFSQSTDRETDRDYRVYTVPIRAAGMLAGFVQVLRDLHGIRDTLGELIGALFAGGALVTLAGGIGAYFLARRALAPIETITRTARHISASDLSARLNMSQAHEEIGQLADTFDAMLERLEESFTRERRFTADASHELRTPLAAMEAILSVIRSEPRTQEEYELALDDLAGETARLRALTEELLQLARGAQPQLSDLAPVDVSVLVHDVVDALQPLAEAKALSVEAQVEPGLAVMGDSDSLIRVFLNLIDNAIKFTDNGGVMVRARSSGDDVLVEISDTGVGIPSDRLEDIFDRFYRADASRSAPGTGLGLSLAAQIVRDHGGGLSVESREGTGSTFTVRLQRLQAQER
jgi:heavy metal sensor kinase